ncbi:MAG: cupin-like domain-containing protein [Calothrix sp. MO_167.B12]|nr:cupin-like domain-containing protein [Calothrix sp. MO_167.B12]
MQLQVEYLNYNSNFKNEFTRLFLNKKPCIIRECTTTWEANSWNFDTLKKIKSSWEYTGNLQGVYIKDPGTQSWEKCKPSMLSTIREKLGINILEYQPNEWIFPLTHPKLIERVDIPQCLRSPSWLQKVPEAIRPIYPRLLIGYEGTGSDLHIDVCNTSNWMALVQGQKRWLVIPPDEKYKVKEFIGKFTPNTEEIICRVNNYYDIQLKAGEIIYLPGKWLHQVSNVEDSIGITYNIFNLFQVVSYCLDSLIPN